MYENGNREPDLETLELFAVIFNVDMNKLTGIKKPATVSDDELGELSLDEAHIISVFLKLSPEARKELVDYARYKAEK